MRRIADTGDLGGDFGAAAETGIDKAQMLQLCQGLAISAHPPRLTQHRFFKGKTEPPQILDDCRFIFGAAARGINIFDTQQKTRARLLCRQRRKGVTEMQRTGGTGSETGCDGHVSVTIMGRYKVNTQDGFEAMALSGPRLAAKSGKARQLVVLVHGYGADGNDLIGLGPALAQSLPDAEFVSPNAPERCPGAGYQWFPIYDLNPSAMRGGVERTAPILQSFIESELQRLALTAENLALIGFSQGTMMSLHLGLGALKPAAIVGFSGVLTGPVPPSSAFPPVFLNHGDADPVIPVQALAMTVQALEAAGVRVKSHVSRGLGHGIDDTGLTLARDFLVQAFAAGGSVPVP